MGTKVDTHKDRKTQPAAQKPARTAAPARDDHLDVQQLSDPLVDPLDSGAESIQFDDKQATPRGATHVVGSAGKTQGAMDGLFTPKLIELLKKDPKLALTGALKKLAKDDLAGPVPGLEQFPTIASDKGGGAKASSNKLALYVANTHYKPTYSDLPKAKSDAQAMQSTMAGRGYKTLGNVREDLNKNQLKAAVDSASADSKLKAGDSLLLYYAGHGLKAGPFGAPKGVKAASNAEATKSQDDEVRFAPYVYSNADLLGAVNRATTRGVNTTLISDACHSGATANMARDQQVERLGKQTQGTGLADLTAIAGQIQGIKVQFEKLATSKKALHARVMALRKGKSTSDVPSVDDMSIEWAFNEVIKDWWANKVHPMLARKAAAFKKATGTDLALPARNRKFLDQTDFLDAMDDLANQVIAAVQAQQSKTKDSG